MPHRILKASTMKTVIIIAAFVVILALVAKAENKDGTVCNDCNRVPTHMLQKRDTIYVKHPNGCIFYECIGNCRQKGHKRGGICTINGCQCLS
ncbi:hypothetical protein K1T71_004889 [Dendrolimus kikuchii]|uniref:Uncharacterized protein n=1 Tax=Dendrolimus kikuchii TaxID=765133 RepID=A0ACC1D5Q6_9NEOP|nr:hypothetical protein K1T71_004889 [Dendrolimus kikuchii]